MKIKQDDVIIEESEPFKNCKLDRKKYADILTQIASTYSKGFVLAINSEWGSGKTTFVRMWQRQLQSEQFNTIYFNAWENDFDDNPLVALMAELKDISGTSTSKEYKLLLNAGAKVAKNIIPDLIKVAATKYLGKEVIADFLSNLSKAATDLFEDEVKQYTAKKKGLLDFKEKLKAFVDSIKTDENKPLVFIIDELDRCRPNYAVSLLEQIKHFFSVEGIVFVLAIDKEQLGNAVRGVYGSEQINAEEYLRRFIDLEYTLEQPNTKVFCKYLFKHFEIADFFLHKGRQMIAPLQNDYDTLLDITIALFEKSNLNLRQQEKVLSHTRIALHAINYDEFALPHLLLPLVFIRTFNRKVFNDIKYKKLTIEELQEEFRKLLPNKIDKYKLPLFIHTEAHLIKSYNNSLDGNMVNLFEKNNEEQGLFVSKIDNTTALDVYFKQLENRNTGGGIKIDFLVNKIDLLDAFTI